MKLHGTLRTIPVQQEYLTVYLIARQPKSNQRKANTERGTARPLQHHIPVLRAQRPDGTEGSQGTLAQSHLRAALAMPAETIHHRAQAFYHKSLIDTGSAWTGWGGTSSPTACSHYHPKMARKTPEVPQAQLCKTPLSAESQQLSTTQAIHRAKKISSERAGKVFTSRAPSMGTIFPHFSWGLQAPAIHFLPPIPTPKWHRLSGDKGTLCYLTAVCREHEMAILGNCPKK